MKIKELSDCFKYDSWLTNNRYANLFSKSYNLYYQIQNPRFKIFHRYIDTNFRFTYLYCIGAGYFKKTHKGPYIIFLSSHRPGDPNYITGFTTYIPPEEDTYFYNWAGVKNPIFVQNPFRNDDCILDISLLNNFFANFSFE